MPTVRILSVDTVVIQISPSDPPQAIITVHGTATTPGWANVRLNPLEKVLSADGIYDLELVGETPDGPVPQVLTPVLATFLMKDDVARLVGVRIEARSNSLTQLVQRAAAGNPIAKTAFLAEESLTTMALGEEVGHGGPKTAALFEEGKTLAFGEEGPSTLSLGEEGTTSFGGEEGGPVPTTLGIGEEGPKTAPLFEEGKPFVGENKGPVGEEFDPGFRTPFGRR